MSNLPNEPQPKKEGGKIKKPSGKCLISNQSQGLVDKQDTIPAT